MKKIIIITITALFVLSCSNNQEVSVDKIISSNDLEKIRAKKTELTPKFKELKEDLKKLEDAISELDSVKKIPLITTLKIEKRPFIHYLELQGNVDTKNNLIVYPEFNGTLTQVYVKEGQRVSKGQTLARIDDGGLSQQLAQLEIQASLAKTTYERQERLWNQKIGSEITYLNTKSNYEAQQEMVNQLKRQLAKTAVKAPFSGIVDDVITEKGSVVAAGQTPILRIVNLNDMYIETAVPESHLKNITKGKNVIVEFPVLDRTVPAKVRQVGSFIDPANRTFKIEVAVQNKDQLIKPNLTAKLKINDYTNKEAILIPQSIISENANNEQYVYTIKDKTPDNKAIVVQQMITTGKTDTDNIEVLTGLKNGDEIIMEGSRVVKADQTVEIKTNTPQSEEK